ncbi:MAG: excinuclease ABC subunit UvrC [Candidatus Omnitrophica bacterium]|nr:excinuclease ABC subunit UvrC [Candidatus Omnitrophota bacterium]
MKRPEIIARLPDTPGVYLMKDRQGTVIYIGKAVSLRKRVASYFAAAVPQGKVAAMVRAMADLDFIRTASEAEALLLEAALIKEYRPKYNVAIKDDKAYPWLRVSVREPYPRLQIVRRIKDDGARYFGPYPSAKLLRQAVSLLRRLFPLRTCNAMPERVCLNYHLQQCPGPCAGRIDAQEYGATVSNLILFLEGKKQQVLRNVTAAMEAAAALRFETAARLRDQLAGLGALSAVRPHAPVADQLAELQAAAQLAAPPALIEGYDISNTGGREAVGSMVRFRAGHPDKREYRRFRIRDVPGIDDYAMLAEILRRRYGGSLSGQLSRPDLIVIDGGRGHLQTAVRQLQAMSITLPVISIAKQFEYIHVPWQTTPLVLPRSSKALRLLMRVRDEAHRFAVRYHRTLRGEKTLTSVFDAIPGIGPKKRALLLRAGDSLGPLRRWTAESLRSIKGINAKTADRIIEYLRRR